MNSTGRAVSGLDESCADMWEKSTIVQNAKGGCYFAVTLFAIYGNPFFGAETRNRRLGTPTHNR